MTHSPHNAPRSTRLREWARRLKRDAHALYLAARDPRTPWYAKALIAATAAYALSPIDLIPDFIPILGYLDDLLIVPAGLALAARLVPPDVLAGCRARAEAAGDRPRSRAAVVFIVAVWAAAVVIVCYLARRLAN